MGNKQNKHLEIKRLLRQASPDDPDSQAKLQKALRRLGALPKPKPPMQLVHEVLDAITAKAGEGLSADWRVELDPRQTIAVGGPNKPTMFRWRIISVHRDWDMECRGHVNLTITVNTLVMDNVERFAAALRGDINAVLPELIERVLQRAMNGDQIDAVGYMMDNIWQRIPRQLTGIADMPVGASAAVPPGRVVFANWSRDMPLTEADILAASQDIIDVYKA